MIGAGFSGMYMIKALRDKLGLKVRAYEAGETVGGRGIGTAIPRQFSVFTAFTRVRARKGCKNSEPSSRESAP